MDDKEIRRKNLRGLIDERYQGVAARLAAALDMKPPQLHRWLSGRQGVSEDSARAIEAMLNLPRKWLDRVHDEPLPTEFSTRTVSHVQQNLPEYADNGVIFHQSPSSAPFYDVPLIKWEDIHVARNFITHPPASQPHTLSTVGGPGIVAAYMPDDSMMRADGGGVPRGTLMFIDLDAAPRVGHLVVVRMGDGLCYLRELVSDAGRWKLMPLNPKYDPAPAPDDRGAYVGVLKYTRIEQIWAHD